MDSMEENTIGRPRQAAGYAPLLTKTIVWGSMLALVFVLRSFFLLMFLTFVFAYIQSALVDRLSKKVPNRTLRVVLVGLIFVGAIILLGNILVPQIKDQTKMFSNNSGKYLKAVDDALDHLSDSYPALEAVLPELKDYEAGVTPWDPKHSAAASLIQPLFGMGEPDEGSHDSVRKIIEQIKEIGSKILAICSAFLLSVLFSFLIVLDLPRLTAGVQGLAKTKLALVYEEAAPSIFHFCRMLGRAFEAQFLIATLNTLMTALGMTIIGLKGELVFLSMIVFFCSFIPIAGVFISSVPITLLALEQGGLSLLLLGVVLIVVIHLIEAYVLNPRIFGHHLRMNSVVVLIILTVAGKIFGVWGLVLGLPVCTYIFRHAIQFEHSREPVKSGD